MPEPGVPEEGIHANSYHGNNAKGANMTPEQLREAVAKVIARAVYKNVPAQTPSHQIDNEQWSALADAAIALMRPVIRAQALEEAAKVADRAVIPMCETSADRIAAAIRALKEKPNE